MSISKKIIAIILFLFSTELFASQLYLTVHCATDPENGKNFYSDLNTGSRMGAKSCGEALSKIPSSFTLIAHDSSSPAWGTAGSAVRNSYVVYLFKQTF